MYQLKTEYDLLAKAIREINRETGIHLKIMDRDVNENNMQIDAIVQMPETGIKLFVEIKKWAAQTNLGAIINQINNFPVPNHGLFVADYINPKMGERLKEANVQFIDTVGNAYIKQRNIYIYIKGNKEQKDITTDQKLKTGRAFQPTGMKIIFAFLRNKELINAPYREIASQAQVALGTVGWVIRDLVAQEYLLEGINNKKRKFAEFDLLLKQWVEDYPYKLKEKYKIGTFTTDDPYWWENINLNQFDAQWGGEIAAAKYTNYLNPKNAIVYISKQNMKGLIKMARLRKPEPHERNNVQVDLIEPFWNRNKEITDQTDLAPPIIAYADLIETGDTRNLDTAKRLYEKYISLI